MATVCSNYEKKITDRILKYHDKNIFVLAASAFLPFDLSLMSFPSEKIYKWGYFPETRKYDIEKLLKKKDRKKILWVGRFLEWKHPETVFSVAKKLKDDGLLFKIEICGSGRMEASLKNLATRMELNSYVTFLGSMSSDQVRSYMESAGIYIFTSDRYEGWGAVLSESMNSGCAVVASHAIGSVPYLIQNNKNGLVYHSGNVNELYMQIKYLLNNPAEQERLGKAAYETITEEWNAEIAAERLVNLSEQLLTDEKLPDLYNAGPCSKANIIKDDWF